MKTSAPVITFTETAPGRVTDQEAKEWIVTYLEPVIEKEFNPSDKVTLLKARYYDSNNRMLPALANGDLMLLRKLDNIFDWGDIHMIQTECWNVVCRPCASIKPDHITLCFNDKNTPAHGMEIPISSIIGIWAIVASSRIHTNNI